MRKEDRKADKKRIIFSCVVDNDPKYFMQSYNLIATLVQTGTATPEEIIIHVTEEKAGK